jgi:hypothetical protein
MHNAKESQFMRTERVTVLASSSEKQWLNKKAASLGMSASEFTRRAWRIYEEKWYAENDPGNVALIAEASAAVPKIAASIERITKRLEDMNRKDEEFLKKMGMSK